MVENPAQAPDNDALSDSARLVWLVASWLWVGVAPARACCKRLTNRWTFSDNGAEGTTPETNGDTP